MQRKGPATVYEVKDIPRSEGSVVGALCSGEWLIGEW